MTILTAELVCLMVIYGGVIFYVLLKTFPTLLLCVAAPLDGIQREGTAERDKLCHQEHTRYQASTPMFSCLVTLYRWNIFPKHCLQALLFSVFWEIFLVLLD